MIPTYINKTHIQKAISELHANPMLKQPIKRYYIENRGQKYSPKQLISLASKFVTGYPLSTKQFKGGKETNLYLKKVGFNVLSIGMSIPISICTALLQQTKKQTNKQRLKLLKHIINQLPNDVDILLLPGGFFSTNKKSNSLYDWVENEVSKLILKLNLTVVLGVDGRYQKDQIAISINQTGIIAMGRKFQPVAKLEDYIKPANDYLTGEIGYSRFFTLKNKSFYLAVCYDSLGVRQLNLDNPNVDVMLNLIHEFTPIGEARSGDTYFAKYGIAGASKQWQIPVFGSTVYSNREIPERWPSGVLYKKSNLSIQSWKYKQNLLRSIKQFYVVSQSEIALIKKYLI